MLEESPRKPKPLPASVTCQLGGKHPDGFFGRSCDVPAASDDDGGCVRTYGCSKHPSNPILDGETESHICIARLAARRTGRSLHGFPFSRLSSGTEKQRCRFRWEVRHTHLHTPVLIEAPSKAVCRVCDNKVLLSMLWLMRRKDKHPGNARGKGNGLSDESNPGGRRSRAGNERQTARGKCDQHA